jgi:hypothetical protein
VIGPVALGVLTLWRSSSIGWTVFGIYLVSLGINYAPLFLYAVRLQSHGSAHAEIADEADDKKKLFRKYRRQSLWVLVPFLVPVVALAQERRRAAVLLRDR